MPKRELHPVCSYPLNVELPVTMINTCSPRTYESMLRMLDLHRIPVPETVMFRKIPISTILENDEYVSRLLDYFRMGFGEFMAKVEVGKISREELEDVVAGVSGMSLIELRMKLFERFERVSANNLRIRLSGVYHPPVVSRNYVVIDGAHRTVALAHIGVDEIYCWFLDIQFWG